MKALFDHIERIKGKPHHVRKRVAFAVAGAGTALIAIFWLVGNVSSGAFVLKETSFADIVGPKGLETSGGDNFQNFAGAAAALETGDAPARIEIVDTSSSTRPAKKPEQTTIPF